MFSNKKNLALILTLIFIILLTIFSFERYQDHYSSGRIAVQIHLKTDKRINELVGKIRELIRIKSLYTSDYTMLKYFIKGTQKNIYVFIYFKYDEKSKLQVQKIELQKLNGDMYDY